MKLYQIQKTFSEFSFAFLKSILNFKELPKQGDSHTDCLFGNTGSKKDG